eukprot:CAMPEP_0196652084 /NCGR_PEP_ID=MMETSP1086-20130531/1307_1 /TAXON_ID=77921 /ORGANISM="Cyanoptyche  gloeocystis , Strain SAG4.97" /LENGTH=109 /DNA_ID=CAMNT_0041982451 /DNA_START=206 /DNA_END=535 /DNA_ORIENTATION=+
MKLQFSGPPNNRGTFMGLRLRASVTNNGGSFGTLRMASDDLIEFEGVVKEVYPGGNFLVQLKDTGDEVKAHLAGKLRRFRIKILLGDTVTVALSPYDLTKGRIVFRKKT